MGKVLAIIAALIGFLSIGLFFVSMSLGAWWFLTASADVFGTNLTVGAYINAFGIGYTSFGSISSSGNVLGIIATLGGLLTAPGSLLLLIGGATKKKALGILGALMILLGPALFIMALIQSAAGGIGYGVEGGNIFYGSASYGGVSITWGLGPGLYMAVVAAILGLIGSAKFD